MSELFIGFGDRLGLAFDAAEDLIFFPLKRHDAVPQPEIVHLATLCLHLLRQAIDFITCLGQRRTGALRVSIGKLSGVGGHQRIDQRCRLPRIGPAR